MARKKLSEPPALHVRITDTYNAVRIRQARARTPTPSYSEIAREVGVTEQTVYRVLTGRTHAEE